MPFNSSLSYFSHVFRLILYAYEYYFPLLEGVQKTVRLSASSALK